MSTHNIHFHGKIRKMLSHLSGDIIIITTCVCVCACVHVCVHACVCVCACMYALMHVIAPHKTLFFFNQEVMIFFLLLNIVGFLQEMPLKAISMPHQDNSSECLSWQNKKNIYLVISLV